MIVLSLASAGVVADYIAENDLLTAPNQSIALFGSHVTVSGVAVVIVPFALGALAAPLFVLGMGLLPGRSGSSTRVLLRAASRASWPSRERVRRPNRNTSRCSGHPRRAHRRRTPPVLPVRASSG